MRKRIGLTIVAAACVAYMLAAASATAATEVGSNCTANSGIGGAITEVQLAKTSPDPLPITAPTSGVVTRWKVNSGVEGAFPQQLKVLRQAGNAKTFQTVAESSTGTVIKGQNAFETRIPVQAGDRLGVGSSAAVLYCTTGNPGDEFAYTLGNTAVGSTIEFTGTAGAIIAVSATVEPDADNDGFGDETQDKCPRSAALQAIECPVITLGSYGLVKRGSVLILASASSQTSVSVSGTVKLPKSSKKGKAKKVTIFGGAKPIAPGKVVPFTLGFSSSLKAALATLPSNKSLKLVVSTTTTDLAGQLSTSRISLKLKGQQKKAKAKQG